MRRILVALAVVAALTMALAPPASAYVPATRTQFTVPALAPGSTTAKQRTFLTAAIGAANATPAGETLTISMYSISDKAVVDALIRAHRRGVRVRYVTWDLDPKGVQLLRLKKALGTNLRARSWFKMCHGSCARSGEGGAHHAKLVLSSRIVDGNGRSVKSLVLVASGNLTLGSSIQQWNEFQTIVDRRLYASAKAYVLAVARDRTQYDFPSATSASGKYQLLFFPRKDLPVDPVLSTLRQVSCEGGGTIRVAMYLWTALRSAMARQLVALRKAGCDVKVLVDGPFTDDGIEAVLRKGGVRTYNTHVGGADGMFVHTKTTIIAARVDGVLRHYVYTGSPNFSYPARHYNSESMLRISSKAEVDLHVRWWNSVLAATRARRT